jgi:hypothetical protein
VFFAPVQAPAHEQRPHLVQMTIDKLRFGAEPYYEDFGYTGAYEEMRPKLNAMSKERHN